MEGRMTVCNMSIEAGARAGMIAPDDTTFQYLNGRSISPRKAPTGMPPWPAGASCPPTTAQLRSPDHHRRRCAGTDDHLWHQSRYGRVDWRRDPRSLPRCRPLERESLTKALAYMGLEGGKPILGHPVNVVFIGSCTNSRISDLRAAAAFSKGRKVNPKVRVMVVPGSMEVKRQAEAEGLPEIFRAAGCDWREPGCSMCIAMNGDQLAAGRIQRLDQQSQLRRTAGQRWQDLPRLPPDRRRQRSHRRCYRCEDLL
jgi:3-isopropylmalate/(R)-2-methylmalate dehydratase large subunit